MDCNAMMSRICDIFAKYCQCTFFFEKSCLHLDVLLYFSQRDTFSSASETDHKCLGFSSEHTVPARYLAIFKIITGIDRKP